ncbi:SDR family oxidoreductase [Longirhabdus pacifica]|uniref:SDR family oxidoreductase n=1 Tax=Longirhabdus pacifica TaxID=2305227 RepID=UPI001008DC48|nr:SDR family oxidoreductase [Longirhabdus pacifica]
MKNAIVTGASRGIGENISNMLLSEGYIVYGIARDFSTCTIQHDAFRSVEADLTDVGKLNTAVEYIKKETNSKLHLLVNNAGVGLFGAHEQLETNALVNMIQLNLQVPLLLSNLFLTQLKHSQGYLVNISSVTAKKISTHGCAYAATKAGLTHFGNSLFEEVRKTGVKVVTIHPDITSTPFYDDLHFEPYESDETTLCASSISETLRHILNQPEGTIVTELSIRPQKNRINKK